MRTGAAASSARSRAVAGWACALVLAGCAGGYTPAAVRPGQTAEEVAASMGAPTGRYALPGGGTRLEYARGPYGRHTYMIDLDASGRVQGWEQVLNEESFATLRPGIESAELLAKIGRPSESAPGGRQGGQIWSYRYETLPTVCQWFQVSVNDIGRVRSLGYATDPMCSSELDADFSRKTQGAAPAAR